MLKRTLVSILVLLALSAVVCPQSPPSRKTAERIFLFHTDEFWLNLHHFLYVLGRAQNKERDASRTAVSGAPADQQLGLKKLNASEQKLWQEIVNEYAEGVSKKDIVFDEPLPAVTSALARAADASSLTAPQLDPSVAANLQRAAPLYRKAWWKKHREANRKWTKSIEALAKRYGASVLAFITKAYQREWPAAGYPIHVSAYSNWAGAYSTTGNLLVMSSLSPDLQDWYALETAFHEGMHQWDETFFEELRQRAIKANKYIPRGFSHAVIFFTAGQAVRHVKHDHVPYADRFGVWERGLAQFKAPLEELWKPYLDGRSTRDEALTALIVRTAVEPPKKQ